jgi:hypothetical protein
MNDRSSLTWLAASVALVGAIATAQAGTLEPPAGPIKPSMKTLDGSRPASRSTRATFRSRS